jgi:NADH/NAD ratio-sensing transcriptional regulator Rex
MDEFCESLTRSLMKLGIKAQMMIVPMHLEKSEFMEKFAKTDGERLLHFTVTQWEANATPRVIDVRYDVTWEFALTVYDKSGNQLASKSVADRVTNDVGHLAVNKEYLQKMADQVFAEQIKYLLNDPGVKASLMN